jgi:hypothetical protein
MKVTAQGDILLIILLKVHLESFFSSYFFFI